MAITTRETSATGVTNKGAPLTNAEVDTNFIELQQEKIENVVEDTSPQLGGNLDFNGNLATSFTSTGIDDNATSTAITIDANEDVVISGSVTATSFIGDGTLLTNVGFFDESATTTYESITYQSSDPNPSRITVGGVNEASGSNMTGELVLGAIKNNSALRSWFVTSSSRGNGYFGIWSSTSATGDARGSERFVIDTSGNVGVGTDSPATNLEIQAGDGVPAVIRTSSSDVSVVADQEVGRFETYSADPSGAGAGVASYMSGISESVVGSQFGMVFGTKGPSDGDAVERVRINATGSVGIDTDDPQALLDISSATTATLRLSNRDTQLAQNQITGQIEFSQSDVSTNGTGISGKIGMKSVPLKPSGGSYYGNVADMVFYVSGDANGRAGDNASLEAMTIAAGGNVGIGTSPDEGKLKVKGSYNGIFIGDGTHPTFGSAEFIQFNRTTTSADLASIGVQNGTAGRLMFSSREGLIFNTGGTSGWEATSESVRIDNAGRVLINQVSPDENLSLEVQAPTGFSVVSGFHSASTQSTISFKDTNTTADYKVRIGSEGDDLLMFAGNAERMRISSTGNAGIGTNFTPSRELQIKLADDTTTTLGQKGGIGLYAPSNTVGNGGEITWSSGANSEVWAAISGSILANGAGVASGHLIFATANLAALPTERMRITSEGRVGIGDITPDAGLTVHNNAGAVIATSNIARQTYTAVGQLQVSTASDGGILIHTNSTSAKGYLSFGDGGIGGRVTYDHAVGQLYVSSEGAEGIRIDNQGNVGIGGVVPTQGALHIFDSNQDRNMTALGNGQLHIDGNGWAFGIALNTDGAQLYTNSAARDLIFGVNETEVARLTPTEATFKQSIHTFGGKLDLGDDASPSLPAYIQNTGTYGNQTSYASALSSAGQIQYAAADHLIADNSIVTSGYPNCWLRVNNGLEFGLGSSTRISYNSNNVFQLGSASVSGYAVLHGADSGTAEGGQLDIKCAGGLGTYSVDAYSDDMRFIMGPANGKFAWYRGQAAGVSMTLDSVGKLALTSPNAGIQIRSGATNTDGFIDWQFTSATVNYIRMGIDYNTRATTGWQVDSGYPITLDCTTQMNFKASGVAKMTMHGANGSLTLGGLTNVGSVTDITGCIQGGGSFGFIASGAGGGQGTFGTNAIAKVSDNSVRAARTHGSYGAAAVSCYWGAIRFMNRNGSVAAGDVLAENGRFDVLGNFLVGRTSASNAATQYGTQMYANGQIYSYTSSAGSSDMYRLYNNTGTLAYSIRANGTVYSVSDRVLKENIADSESALAIVNDIKVRSFDWREDGEHVSHGFIAQELNEAYPEAASEPLEDQVHWAVDYTRLVPVLAKAIQEQKVMIETLQAEVAALKGA
jgi:hypothetical protein